MSVEDQDFGLHQAKHAVLDAISYEGMSDANKDGLNRTLRLLRDLQAVVLSDESPAVRVSQLLRILGCKVASEVFTFSVTSYWLNW